MKNLTDFKSGCFICGNDLIYKDKEESQKCMYCQNTFNSNTICINGHYICDQCHASSANTIIEKSCITSRSTDPIKLAIDLMKHPAVKMHGPEHHFLVPAALLAGHYNKAENFSEKETKIKKARTRAEKVLGGFCGTHGNCGAAVGTGIFMSLITNSTPLSKSGWKESNMMTAKALSTIAEHGGPRCCKRDSFLAIYSALEYFDKDVQGSKNLICEFSHLNKECIKRKCPFYKPDS